MKSELGSKIEFEFFYFRSIQCSRLSVHKNLVFAFILYYIVQIILLEPHVNERQNSYHNNVSTAHCGKAPKSVQFLKNIAKNCEFEFGRQFEFSCSNHFFFFFTHSSQFVHENWKKVNFFRAKIQKLNYDFAFDSKTKPQNWIFTNVIFLQVYNVLISLHLLTKMSHTSWLFNEGFYLHSRITTSIFDSDAPFLFFHSIGWGT